MRKRDRQKERAKELRKRNRQLFSDFKKQGGPHKGKTKKRKSTKDFLEDLEQEEEQENGEIREEEAF